MKVNEIKTVYHLDNLCNRDYDYITNIAITLKGIKKLYSFLRSGNIDSEERGYICKKIVEDSYSVIDAIIGMLGYKIQFSCQKCNKKGRCRYYSNVIFEGKTKYECNDKLFKKANDYLEKLKIVGFQSGFKNYYREYRDVRNSIHLTKRSKAISNNENYTVNTCTYALRFMDDLIEKINENFNCFIKENGCSIKHHFGELFENKK